MNTQNHYRALVTGASGGIGSAICHALVDAARARGQVPVIAAVASTRGPKLDALLSALEEKGAVTFGLAADLTDPDAVNELVSEAVRLCGGLDTLVSNAGSSVAGKLAELSLEAWDATFALNTRATWLLAKAAFETLAAQRGNVVAIASMSGLSPHPGYGAYSAAKAALIMLCRQLAQEWAPHGIRVNTVSPGMIHTPLTDAIYQDAEVKAKREAMIPLGRIGQPEDIARAVVYLSGPDASYVTGENLKVDGGVCDHLLATIPGRSKPA